MPSFTIKSNDWTVLISPSVVFQSLPQLNVNQDEELYLSLKLLGQFTKPWFAQTVPNSNKISAVLRFLLHSPFIVQCGKHNCETLMKTAWKTRNQSINQKLIPKRSIMLSFDVSSALTNVRFNWNELIHGFKIFVWHKKLGVLQERYQHKAKYVR